MKKCQKITKKAVGFHKEYLTNQNAGAIIYNRAGMSCEFFHAFQEGLPC